MIKGFLYLKGYYRMIIYFPGPYPGELLYSMWARFSDHVRYPSERRVLIDLFGTDNVRPIVDLPCQISLFTKKLPESYKYTTEDFIDQHTLFPLYSPFMPSERATDLRELMIASESVGHPRGFYRKFGITNSLAPRTPWLRYCPVCWQEDRANFGEAYWHRLHQVPGFEICPIHATFIENSSVRIRGFLSGRSLVSAEHILPITSPHYADLSLLCRVLIRIAEDIGYVLEHPGMSLSHHLFRDQYHTLLARQGFLTKGGKVHNVELMNAFVDYYTPSLLHQFNCEMDQCNPSSSWLVRLINMTREYQHPLHHLLAMHFLATTVEDFFCQKIKPSFPFGEGSWPCLNPACKYYKQKCINIYRTEYRQGKANRPSGIFSCTCGFAYSRSGPDHLLEDTLRKDTVLSYGALWEAKLQELWLNPTMTCRDIAHFFGMSEGNVKRRAIKLHLAVPRISPYQRKGRPKLIRDPQWYRTRWLADIEADPEKGITPLRNEELGVYKWLYKHDREWLITHRPPSKPWRRRGGPKKELTFQILKANLQPQDEMSRDAVIADAVKNAAQQILLTPERPRRVSTSAISSYVPQLDWLRRKPEKMPLTIQALNEVVETQEEFAIRRIRWVMQQYQKKQIIPSRNEFLKTSNFRELLHLPSVKQALESALGELLDPT